MLTFAKYTFWTILLSCLLVLSLPRSSFAITTEEILNPRQNYGGWVTDMAQILTQETETKLNRTIDRLKSKTSDEIAVVTVPTTAPATGSKEFATELFNRWGIGKQGLNNGVLVLISASDPRIEIETGYGLETILPDALVGDIIDTQMIPYFKQDKFDEGAIAGVNTIVNYLDASVVTTSANKQLSVAALLSISGILILLGNLLIIGLYNRDRPQSSKIKQPTQSSRKNNTSTSSDSSHYDWGSSSSDSGSFGGGAGGDW